MSKPPSAIRNLTLPSKSLLRSLLITRDQLANLTFPSDKSFKHNEKAQYLSDGADSIIRSIAAGSSPLFLAGTVPIYMAHRMDRYCCRANHGPLLVHGGAESVPRRNSLVSTFPHGEILPLNANMLMLKNIRLFPFSVTIGALSLLFMVYINIQSQNGSLVPNEIMAFAFMFFVLYLTGLVEICIQLFGAGGVSGNCSRYVYGEKYSGASIYTLAWLEQYMICKSKAQQSRCRDTWCTCEEQSLMCR